MSAAFLNVDLELRSESDLGDLVRELEAKLLLLHHGEVEGRRFASFELSMLESESPDSTCRGLLDVLDNISESSRRILESCESITFAVGYDGGDSRLMDSPIGAESLRRIAAMGGDISISIYPGEQTPS